MNFNALIELTHAGEVSDSLRIIVISRGIQPGCLKQNYVCIISILFTVKPPNPLHSVVRQIHWITISHLSPPLKFVKCLSWFKGYPTNFGDWLNASKADVENVWKLLRIIGTRRQIRSDLTTNHNAGWYQVIQAQSLQLLREIKIKSRLLS